MGVVYRAVDERLGRAVAIKVLPPEATADSDRKRRFVQEARAASALNHPHIVTIYEIDEWEGTTFIAMELVQGTPLDKVLAGGSLSVPQALDYAAQIASALDAAHTAGLVHRDIKPANIIVCPNGIVKVLDFGLAKLVQRAASDLTMSVAGTSPGMIVGTAAYMSPEQAQGLPVDARSDLFSFGAVLYEMLSGQRPFKGSSDVGLLTALLRDKPAPLRSVRSDAPPEAQAIVERALEKEPSARYQSAAAMRTDLLGLHARLTRPAEPTWRKARVLVPVAAALIAIAAFGAWQAVHARRAAWARTVAIQDIERMYFSGHTLEAVRLARVAEQYAPDDIARIRATWVNFPLVTEPAGARVEVRNYADTTGPWEFIGTSPIRNVRLPFSYYRVRLSLDGYQTLEVSAQGGRAPVKLTRESETAPGMVFVPGGSFGTGVAPPVVLPDFWIDRLEVTNAEYKKFVDAGGYREPKYWKPPFRDGDRELTFEQATARFKDATDRPGPSTWELGSYPEGQADFPVAGISWFEAAAYAEFMGKSLPTLYHWYRAAGTDEIYSDILQLSNFESKGPARAGERAGVGPWGTLDMAGNVKEWCFNQVLDGSRRYILGGGWNEPSYRFAEQDAQEPWERLNTFGVRLVKNLGAADAATVPVGRVTPDPRTVVPASDEEFAFLRRFYEYDRTPLDAKVESVDDSSPYWRKEKVSYAAAYGNERIPAYLFLPKNATAPYQTVVFFPSAYARTITSSTALDLGTFEFIVRSGRALLYPIYQGTFERHGTAQAGPSGMRDMHVQWAKDVFRSVDYLETRPEIDKQKLAYYSLSMGAFFGPIPTSLEPRFKVAVFAAAGLRYGYPPEVQPANFEPRVKIPVLYVHGKDDFGVPSAAQDRFFELLGSAEKKNVVLDGGHVPQDIKGLFKEVLNWYDTYLGPVK